MSAWNVIYISNIRKILELFDIANNINPVCKIYTA